MSDVDDWVPPDLPTNPTWEQVQRWTNVAVLAETCRRDYEALGFPITEQQAWEQAEREWEKFHGE